MTRLRRERLARGLTLRECAADIGGISHAMLANLERGITTRPHPGNRLRIERYFGLSLERLMQPYNDDDRPAKAGRQEFATTSAAADLGAAKEGALR